MTEPTTPRTRTPKRGGHAAAGARQVAAGLSVGAALVLVGAMAQGARSAAFTEAAAAAPDPVEETIPDPTVATVPTVAPRVSPQPTTAPKRVGTTTPPTSPPTSAVRTPSVKKAPKTTKPVTKTRGT